MSSNSSIADSFTLLSKLLDIHGENSFKSKSYSSAAFAIEKLTVPLTEMPAEKIQYIKGIGPSSAQKIIEIIETGRLVALEEIISHTPSGVIEMLRIKGLGPKKIHTIWKEMELETIGELLYACRENRLKLYKGFGEKTQQNVMEAIEFYQRHLGSQLYAEAEAYGSVILESLQQGLPEKRFKITGSLARQLETMESIDFITDAGKPELMPLLNQWEGFEIHEERENLLLLSSPMGIKIQIQIAEEKNFMADHIRLSSADVFYDALKSSYSIPEHAKEEMDFFQAMNLSPIPACLRESAAIIHQAEKNQLPVLIQPEDIRGIIHCHSNWSDGSNSLEEMAKAAKEKGLEYLVISDHSQTASYAQGLRPERVLAQHELIDELNEQLKPFKIFKSIESDILQDGSLDYHEDILKRFDLVIASVHSNLKMSEEKAMMRLMRAIENPYTRILGHMTGRLLLSRPGYPVDHKKIIDACASNGVVIELNAHPSRLDMDWRQISYAIEKGVLISINPDAHDIDGMDLTKYGVYVAQKAGVTKADNLSSMSLVEFESWVKLSGSGFTG
jgi:DNA polymerase (family 10)